MTPFEPSAINLGHWLGDHNFYPIRIFFHMKPNFSDEWDEIFSGNIYPGTLFRRDFLFKDFFLEDLYSANLRFSLTNDSHQD